MASTSNLERVDGVPSSPADFPAAHSQVCVGKDEAWQGKVEGEEEGGPVL